MNLLIDMNLSPLWVEYFGSAGVASRHWSAIGDSRASDREIMAFAREHGLVVFTHDLDFGNILAATHARGPSVVQVRTQDPVPTVIGPLVITALAEHGALLQRGALITIEADRLRARVLPIVPGIRIR